MIATRLPDAELEVMQALWQIGKPSLRSEIQHVLSKTHPMAHTTLLTLLSRLGERGFVKAEKNGRSFLYTPLVSREDYLAQQSKRFLDKICGGSIPAFAAALCQGALSKEELSELRALLEKEGL